MGDWLSAAREYLAGMDVKDRNGEESDGREDGE